MRTKVKQYKNKVERRRALIRSKIKGTSDRPRLVVFRSNRYIYAQLIDDSKGVTILNLSDVKAKEKSKVKRAEEIGAEIGKKAKALGINNIVFDRRGYKYHGRVKALAEGARAEGLKF